MALTHTMALAVKDIVALAITCKKCGASVTIPVAETNALNNEKCCVSCDEPLWRGGDDTTFARALIEASVGKPLNRFTLVVNASVPTRTLMESVDRSPDKSAD